MVCVTEPLRRLRLLFSVSMAHAGRTPVRLYNPDSTIGRLPTSLYEAAATVVSPPTSLL